MVHQYNSTTYGSVYRCTTVVLPNPLLVNRAPELTDFALQIALPHFMRIFLGRVLAHYHSTEHGLSVTTIYDRLPLLLATSTTVLVLVAVRIPAWR